MRKKATKIQNSNMKGTKWEIFEVAINLFANRGFANVGVRDIASVVGIKSASIYNHFENKDAILERIYEYFDENYFKGFTDTNDILATIPTSSPREVLEKLSVASPSKEYEILRKILLIVVTEYNNDDRAKKVLSKVLEMMIGRFSQALNRMIELEVIEPMDVELFTTIYMSFSMSATVSQYNGIRMLPYDKWQEGRRMLLGLVRKR